MADGGTRDEVWRLLTQVIRRKSGLPKSIAGNSVLNKIDVKSISNTLQFMAQAVLGVMSL